MLSTRASAATTRQPSAPGPAVDPGGWLRPGDAIVSPETGLQYRIGELLGHGGFGEVYLARRLTRSAAVPATVCVKVSRRMDGWLREAYIGQLLDGHPRAIAVYEAFPLTREDGRILYCLVIEYASHGDLSAFLRRSGKGWRETTARREIAGILEVLRKLHRGQTLHRDLTPLNVFVCDGRRLKLGDFGIARQQSDRRGVTARTMNALTAPSDILARAVPKWQARDDVYQVGQLLAMLIKGDARTRIRTAAVVHSSPSARTTVVVRGRPNPLQAAGRDAGLKLMEVKRLREKGHRVTLLNEAQFWRLAGQPGRSDA